MLKRSSDDGGDSAADMRHRVAIAEQRLRRLGSDAAHELRNPVAAARASLEAALRGARSNEGRTDLIRHSLRDVQRLWVVVEGLVSLSRSAEETPLLDRQPVSLLDLLSETIALLASTAREKGVRFVENIVGDPVVAGDGDRLRLLFFKLLDNAVRFSPGGESVALSLTVEGSRVQLTVTDRGPGIPESDRSNLFDYARYLQDDGAEPYHGSGFGLSLAQSIAQAHGGEIRVVNQSEPGCRLELTLSQILPERVPSGAATTRHPR